MDPHTHPATHYTPSGAFPKHEPPKGLIYARNAAAVAAFAMALLLISALAVKALGNIADTVIDARVSMSLYESGF
jgi:hypothetical protein